MTDDAGDALERFERQTALPMLVLSVLIVPLLLAPLILDLSPGAETSILVIDWMIWAAFAVEYRVRLYLAPRKWPFVKTNKIDLLVIFLPFLRPLRVVRSARALRLLRAARAVSLFGRALDAGREVLTRHKLNYALLVTGVVVIGSAGLVLTFEQGAPEANIDSFGDALWWAVTTVTTVGYGDTFPTTPGGRGVAAVLMLIGIGVFGLLAASLASYFVERDEGQHVDPRLQEMSDRLERIEALLLQQGEATIRERESEDQPSP